MKIKFIFFILLYFVLNTFALAKEEINILTWWGYLNAPWIKNYIEKNCDVELSIDDYFSNEDFLRRFGSMDANYDIAVFADTIFNLVKNNITNTGGKINTVVRDYLPYIRHQYEVRHYPNNVVYFEHAITGFLWDKNLVNINANMDIYTLFKSAGTNVTVFMDDPIETKLIIKNLTKDEFFRITQKSHVLITNEIDQFDNKNNFAFAYMWSGEATKHLLRASNKYQFLIHPNYSLFSSDLLAALNKKKSTICVANIMASKKFLDRLQSEAYYISPYGDTTKYNDPRISIFYKKILKDISKYQWVEPTSKKQFYETNKTWNYIKLHTESNLQLVPSNG